MPLAPSSHRRHTTGAHVHYPWPRTEIIRLNPQRTRPTGGRFVKRRRLDQQLTLTWESRSHAVEGLPAQNAAFASASYAAGGEDGVADAVSRGVVADAAGVDGDGGGGDIGEGGGGG